MMGESDRHHPISTTLFKKSKSPTNKKKREYICYIQSLNFSSKLVSSSSNQLVMMKTQPSFFHPKKYSLSFTHKRCFSPTHIVLKDSLQMLLTHRQVPIAKNILMLHMLTMILQIISDKHLNIVYVYLQYMTWGIIFLDFFMAIATTHLGNWTLP